MNKIIVLGGGSAGWMTAATLINTFPKKEIVLIESPNTPIIGVGESTLGQINKWLNLLNIKDKDFMPHTDASYKLSIRFEDFMKKVMVVFIIRLEEHLKMICLGENKTGLLKNI